jgi:hypothetical protein
MRTETAFAGFSKTVSAGWIGWFTRGEARGKAGMGCYESIGLEQPWGIYHPFQAIDRMIPQVRATTQSGWSGFLCLPRLQEVT